MYFFHVMDCMAERSKSYSPEERYKLIGKLMEEVKLKRYFTLTKLAYSGFKSQFKYPAQHPLFFKNKAF